MIILTSPRAGLDTSVLTATPRIKVKKTSVKPKTGHAATLVVHVPNAVSAHIPAHIPAHIAGASRRPKQAAQFLGISMATYWRWCKDRPDFPKPLRLSTRCTATPANVLMQWRDAQANNGGQA